MPFTTTMPTYIDLFSGAGGLSAGFEAAGFRNVFSLDCDKGFCKTYKRNFPHHTLIEKDIATVSRQEIVSLIGDNTVDVVIGGPPCQGFSIAGTIGRKFIDDPRNQLFEEFVRVVEIVRPRCVVMENVARLYTHNNGKTREEIIARFKQAGYTVRCEILNSADYGVPQIRRRVIFIGTRTGEAILFPEKTVSVHKTVREAIGDLPALESGERASHVPNHVAMKHTAQMLKKMSYVKEGGTRAAIPSALRPRTGDMRKYIRYTGAKPSITVTGDMRKVFHYRQNRALTVRELARLQSFGDQFVFESTSISQQQQVGNAVPPLMAEAIAGAIKKMLNKS